MMPEIERLFSLEGRVAIITGGAGRLGYQHALALRGSGASVHSFDVRENRELLDLDVVQHFVDITYEENVRHAVERVLKKEGRIDILVNNAVIDPPLPKEGEVWWEPYPEYPMEKWNEEIAVGLTGAHIVCKAVAPQMVEQQNGSIINVSSTTGITAPNHRKYPKGHFKSPAYPVVKSALLGLTRAWASYFAIEAPMVRVNTVCFGAVNFKEITPELKEQYKDRNMMGRMARPEEYCGAMIFLASDASAFMTAQTLIIDGGQTAQ